MMGLNALGKGDWRGISRHFVQTRTPTQVASHAQKYFIRQQNTQKRKRRASLFDIQQGPGDGTTTFVAQQMSGGSQNGGSDATIATTTTKVKGSNNGTSSSLTKMLKNNGKGLPNDKLNSREEESMRTLADMVLTHDARQQKNNMKQQRQDQNEQQKQQQQQHQQFLREQKEYANGHPIAGQFYGAQSPPQTIPMTGSYYYNPMFAPPHSFMPQHAASPTEMCMFPPLDPSQQQNMNEWMAQMQRNSAALQQQQQMAIASALAAGIHPSMWTAQYNMLLSGQNPATMGIPRPSSQSAETQSTAETKEPRKIGGANLAQKRLSDSCNSYQGRDSPVDAAGLYRPVAGYPSRTEWLGATLPQKIIPGPSSNNAAAEP